MAAAPKERAYQKYAWVFPFVLGFFFVVIGPLAIIRGYTAVGVSQEPALTPSVAINDLNSLAQEIGLFNIFYGVLMIIVGWLGIRNGTKFAKCQRQLRVSFLTPSTADMDGLGSKSVLQLTCAKPRN